VPGGSEFQGNIIFDDIFLMSGGSPGSPNDLVGTNGVQDIFVIDATHLHELPGPPNTVPFGVQWITNYSFADGDVVAFINAPAGANLSQTGGGNTHIEFSQNNPPDFFQYIVNVTAPVVISIISTDDTVTLPNGDVITVTPPL